MLDPRAPQVGALPAFLLRGVRSGVEGAPTGPWPKLSGGESLSF